MASRPESYADSFGPPGQQNFDNIRLPTLEPPRGSYLAYEGSNGTLRDTYATNTPNYSSPLLAATGNKDEPDSYSPEPTRKNRPWSRWLLCIGAIAVIILAVILAVYFAVIKPHQNRAADASGASGANPSGKPSSRTATSGGDGSTVTTEDGSTFTYKNTFGGYWVSDPNDPYNNNARPNSWTPPLNTSWNWGTDRIFGVNLGGLFVLEPFITPDIFQKYPGAIDEWSLSTLMAADTANGGLNQLEDHYKTFITEQDIAEIAGAGLNWIRLPIPYWAIETWPGEPFLAKTSWKYILKVIGWARKYGIRVNLDLHTAPGSQNGYNHSGKYGQVNFLNGVMGIANAQRLLNYIRIVTEFITQPEYQAVIPMFGIINEALLTTIGRDQLTSFYLEAHDMIRSITGIGEGNGAYISIHDGFQGVSSWADFLPGSDRVILDTHPYFAFDGQPNDDPIATGTGSNAGGVWPGRACSSWGPGVNTSQVAFGVTVAGEFSNGYNDCGFYLKGIPGTTTYGGDCSLWEDYTQWNESTIAGVKAFGMASMDALQNWFFWTWKIANSSTTGTVGSPLWSYQLGVEQGWIPADPREASGTCAAEGVSGPIFDGTYESWQTGGAGAGAIAATARAEFGQWPPAVISGVGGAPVGVLPTYTPTGTVATLPPAQLTASATHTVSSGDGWADPQDTAAGPATIPGCIYPDPWNAISAAVPTVFCGSGVIAPVADETSTTAQAAIITTVSTTALTTALTTATTSSPTLTGIAIPTVTTGIVAPTLTARHIR